MRQQAAVQQIGGKEELIAKFESQSEASDFLYLFGAPAAFGLARYFEAASWVSMILAVLAVVTMKPILEILHQHLDRGAAVVRGPISVTRQGFVLPGQVHIGARDLISFKVTSSESPGKNKPLVTHNGGQFRVNGPESMIEAITVAFSPWVQVEQLKPESSWRLVKAVPVVFGFIVGGVTMVVGFVTLPDAALAIPIGTVILGLAEMLRRFLFGR